MRTFELNYLLTRLSSFVNKIDDDPIYMLKGLNTSKVYISDFERVQHLSMKLNPYETPQIDQKIVDDLKWINRKRTESRKTVKFPMSFGKSSLSRQLRRLRNS
jgi:hypothetical protein